MSRPVALLAACLALCSGCVAPNGPATSDLTDLRAPAPPAGVDALARWRENFSEWTTQIRALTTPPITFEAADAPSPDYPDAAWQVIRAYLDRFTLGPGECLAFTAPHGPETPFPDHQPLRDIAAARTVDVRRLIMAGQMNEAVARAREGLAQARASLLGQVGLVPLIHATGVWQSALDGVHSLARSPALPPSAADALRLELEADAGLAPAALARAMRGEYAYVLGVVADRMPTTRDADLQLSAVGSLAMSPPEPLAPGDVALGLQPRDIHMATATRAEFSRDMTAWLAPLEAGRLPPSDWFEKTTARQLTLRRSEIAALLAFGDGDTRPETVQAAQAELDTVENPVGKILYVLMTSRWDVFSDSLRRREAARAAVCGLLAWRSAGGPAPWSTLVAAGQLSTPPLDPFSGADLHWEASPEPRVWSVFTNGRDDGGRPELGNVGQPDDLVWLW